VSGLQRITEDRETVYKDKTQGMESGNRSFGKLRRSWVDGGKIRENDGECCGPRVLSVKSGLCIYRTRPET